MRPYMVTVTPKRPNDPVWVNTHVGYAAIVHADSESMALLIAGAVFSANDDDWDPSQSNITVTS